MESTYKNKLLKPTIIFKKERKKAVKIKRLKGFLGFITQYPIPGKMKPSFRAARCSLEFKNNGKERVSSLLRK